MSERTRILLVDDDPAIAKALRRTLEGCAVPVRVEVCADVTSAKAALRDYPFDLILSDFELPDGTGADVLASALALRPRAFRALVTGHRTWDTASLAVNEGGALRVISKPWTARAIHSMVEAATRRADEASETWRPPALQASTEWLRTQRESLERELMRRTGDLGAALLCALEHRVAGSVARARRLSVLAASLATDSGLADELVAEVRLAGMLHGVGQLAMAGAGGGPAMFDLGRAILQEVPALSRVARMVGDCGCSSEGSGTLDIGGRILAVGLRFLELSRAGCVDPSAALQRDPGGLDRAIVQLLVALGPRLTALSAEERR
ncbi:MAG: hypothetical protein NVS3B10_12490 [Polyangiales bacterium]